MIQETQDIFKRKSQNFRSHSLDRAKKLGIPVSSVPMPREFAEWLTLQPITIKRKRAYLTCYLTGELVPLAKIELDHRVPISRGGSFQVFNLGVTDARMNQAKSNRTQNEFMELLKLIETWDDGGKSLIADLRSGQSRRYRF